jgi:hypothetical protein
MITVPLVTPLMVSPDVAGPFIALCQQESVTEQTSLSLLLTTIRNTPHVLRCDTLFQVL